MKPPTQPSNSCFPIHAPLPSAFEILVVAPVANPFLLDWVPPGYRRQGPIVAGSGYHDVVTPQIGILQQRGYSLHPGDQTNNPQPAGVWHHVSIAVKESYPPLGTTLDQAGGIDAGAIDALGNDASILKARIHLAMGNSRTRSFDFDIGAGVEFDVRCYGVLGIDVLIPNPAGPGGVPEDLAASLTALATIVTTAVYCSASKSAHRVPLTYTQSFSTPGDGGLVAMPVVAAAREAQVFFPSEAIAAGGELVFGFTPTNPIDAQLAPTFTFIPVGTVTVPAGQSYTPLTLIPGDANVLVVRGVTGSYTATIVQTLNV